MSLVISIGLVLLFSAFIIYDTQLIIGKGKHSIGLDEYIFGKKKLKYN